MAVAHRCQCPPYRRINTLTTQLANRETAKAEDMMRAAVVNAQQSFDEMYK